MLLGASEDMLEGRREEKEEEGEWHRRVLLTKATHSRRGSPTAQTKQRRIGTHTQTNRQWMDDSKVAHEITALSLFNHEKMSNLETMRAHPQMLLLMH